MPPLKQTPDARRSAKPYSLRVRASAPHMAVIQLVAEAEDVTHGEAIRRIIERYADTVLDEQGRGFWDRALLVQSVEPAKAWIKRHGDRRRVR